MSTFRLGIGSVRAYAALGQTLLGGTVLGTPRSWSDLVWTDLTPWLRGRLDIKRGKLDERADIQASTATVTLDNNDGRFDRDNPFSPYVDGSGDTLLLPYTPIKIVWAPGVADTAEQGLFFGTTGDDWLVSRNVENDSTVTLKCVDLLALLSRCKLSAYLPEQSTWDRIQSVLDLALWPKLSATVPYHRVLYGDEGGSVCVATQLDGHTATEAIMLALRTEGIYRTIAGIDKDGNFAFLGRYGPFTPPWNEVQATFGTAVGAIPCGVVEPGSAGRNVYTQAKVSFLEVGPSSVPVKAPDALPAGSNYFLTLDVYTELDGISGSVPAGACFDLGTARVITTTADIAAADLGFPFTAIAQDIPAGATAVYQSNVAIAADNTAQLRYGKTELAYTGLLLPNRSEAHAMAEDMLLEYAAPRPRIDAINLSGIYDDVTADQIVRLAIGDLIRFAFEPYYSLGPVAIDLRLHGVEFSFVEDDCDVKLRVAPAPVDRDFWTLGADDSDSAGSSMGATDGTGTAVLSF